MNAESKVKASDVTTLQDFNCSVHPIGSRTPLCAGFDEYKGTICTLRPGDAGGELTEWRQQFTEHLNL